MFFFLPYKIGKGLYIGDGVNHPKIENRVHAHQQKEAELQKRELMQKLKKEIKKKTRSSS